LRDIWSFHLEPTCPLADEFYDRSQTSIMWLLLSIWHIPITSYLYVLDIRFSHIMYSLRQLQPTTLSYSVLSKVHQPFQPHRTANGRHASQKPTRPGGFCCHAGIIPDQVRSIKLNTIVACFPVFQGLLWSVGLQLQTYIHSISHSLRDQRKGVRLQECWVSRVSNEI